MFAREGRKLLILYPEDKMKDYWDRVISVALIITCSFTPYMVAFYSDFQTDFWNFLNYLIDIIFFIDILVIFNKAYYDENFKLIEDRKSIALNYFKGWLLIDCISVIPFNLILDMVSHVNQMARIFRLGRLYKLIKLLRLIKILKIFKNSGKAFAIARDIFQIGNGLQRIVFFVIASSIIIHIFACLWVFLCHMSQDSGAITWLDDQDKSLSNVEIYLTSYYFMITTFSTVGYGDISIQNSVEKLFCIFVMVIGVTAFASGTSFLTNLLQTYDQENSRLHERVVQLNHIYKEY